MNRQRSLTDKAIITLSFDDGRKDNYRVVKEILEGKCIPATFNIITGYVLGNISMEAIPSLSMEELKEMARNPSLEFAGHGRNHNNELDDICAGREELLKWLGQSCDDVMIKIGFASPHSDMSVEYINDNKNFFYDNGFLYVRTGANYRTWRRLRILMRRIARIIKSATLFKFAYSEMLMDGSENGIAIISVPILRETSLRQIESLIKLAIKEKKWCVLMFHSIVEKNDPLYSNTWSWDYSDFNELCDFLDALRAENKLKIMTTIDAFREMRKDVE